MKSRPAYFIPTANRELRTTAVIVVEPERSSPEDPRHDAARAEDDARALTETLQRIFPANVLWRVARNLDEATKQVQPGRA